MLTAPQSTELKQQVSRSLGRAEDIWNKVGREVQLIEARPLVDIGIDDPSDCGGNSNSFIEGCEAYAEEQSEEEQ